MYFLDLDTMLLKVFNFLRSEVRFLVAMAESADLLRVHPVEEADLASVSPGVDIAVVSECH